MKIRQVQVRRFRNFAADQPPISFVDEATGQVRPLTVLVGSNGSGKTTLFEVVEGLLRMAASFDLSSHFGYKLPPALAALESRGGAWVDLEFSLPLRSPSDNTMNNHLRILLGQSEDVEPGNEQTNRVAVEGILFTGGQPASFSELRILLNNLQTGWTDAGLLHFPANRWVDYNRRGAIAPPPETNEWIFRFAPQHAWQGSLAQLWVWQNYLDLEEGQSGRKNLAPFIEIVETILGRGQRVHIQKGRVTIRRPHLGDEVEPHELPAGEQQVLTLFGELARRLRPGAAVLIDEVESSLHPALQRVVLYHLRQLSRRYDLQVIVTTHSMEIVSAVAPHEVVNLDDMVERERSRREDAPVEGAA